MEQAATTNRLHELYADYAAYLHNYIYRLTRDREEAADLVQEVFLRLCQQDGVPRHPKAWLSRTGYRLFVDQWRRKQRHAWLPLDRAVPCDATPEQAVLDREFERRLRQLLYRLHPRAHAALYLRIYDECSYGEIARRLDCPENTVKTDLRRGRKKLAEWLSSAADSSYNRGRTTSGAPMRRGWE